MPLKPLEIKVRILKNGDSIAGLARLWGCSREVLSRVIHRYDGTYYPDVRAKLATYLNVPTASVGREPTRKSLQRHTEEATA